MQMSICLAGISRSLAETLDVQAIFFVQGKVLVFRESSTTPRNAGELSHVGRNEQGKRPC